MRRGAPTRNDRDSGQKLGARGIGIDIDPERIKEVTETLKKSGSGDEVTYIQGDLFQQDLSPTHGLLEERVQVQGSGTAGLDQVESPDCHDKCCAAMGCVSIVRLPNLRMRMTPMAAWPSIVPAKSKGTMMESKSQHVRFCTSSDGVQLAYEKIGKGPPVVRAAYWLTHLEHDNQSIIWGPWLREFASHATLIRYDQRGCGLSDRAVAKISFDAWLQDLEAVVDAAGLARFTLLGMSQGAAISIAYAVRHPERVARLVLYGGFAQGRRRRGSPEQVEEAELHERAILLGWGRENPAFRQLFTSQFMANARPEELAAWDEMQRLSCSPETAARIVKVTHDIDVTPLLAQVRVPTLVMHSTHDARIPFALGRSIASQIPDAHFVPLESAGHNLMSREAAFGRFFAELGAFAAEPGAPGSPNIAGLTAREAELLELLARGKSNDEIAAAAGISPKTVRNVVSMLFDKLAVRTRAEAIVKARDAGFGSG